MSNLIYLDYHSTTPCDPRVVKAMLPFFTSECANPSNSYHLAGRKALNKIEDSRGMISALIGAQPSEIILTSGATESNNIAILGIAHAYQGDRKKIVTTEIEHKSVLKPIECLEKQGFDVGYLPLDETGTIMIEDIDDIIDENTLLVSVQAANNEIGTIQPVDLLASKAHDMGAIFHCDAAQAVGKVPVNVKKLDVDLLSISAHKLYGPKGVGALYVKRDRKLALEPLVWGGDQEKNLRPGTYNVPGIVGFGEACKLCKDEMAEEALRIEGFRDLLEQGLIEKIDDLMINGNKQNRLFGNSSITFPGIEGDALLLNLPHLALSIGSACNTGVIEPSYVLTSIGIPRDLATSTIRVGLGRFTTRSEIIQSIGFITEAYEYLKNKLI